MFHLVQGIGGYDAARPFRPWLYTIATNLFRNHVKRAEHRFRQAGDETTDEVPDEREPSLDERWTAEDMSKRLLFELQRLPDLQREVIILRYYEELKLADIAEMLDMPLGTIKSRLRLGLERLRSLLEVEER
jgi:RNA polymerase sigma-70 factor (ECF subfamily)